MATSRQIPIEKEFFCDGHYYVLTSYSLGGSKMTADGLAQILGNAAAEKITPLLKAGVCLPLFFDGDCALDGETLFVVGALEKTHAGAWIGRLTSRLSIPCGKLVLVAGGGDGAELERAISGDPPEKNNVIYQTINIDPGNYRVDLYAYLKSMTVAQHESELDEEEIEKKYKHLPEVSESYVIQLSPLDKKEIPLPKLVPEVNWCGVFEFRTPK